MIQYTLPMIALTLTLSACAAGPDAQAQTGADPDLLCEDSGTGLGDNLLPDPNDDDTVTPGDGKTDLDGDGNCGLGNNPDKIDPDNPGKHGN